MSRALLSATLLLLAGCTTVRPGVPRLGSLTLDEKIGQLFVVAAHGTFMNQSSEGYQRLLRQVRDERVGGVIWYVSDVYETAWLNERLQSAAKVPLLVSADLEAGIGMRFNDTTYWPPAMAVAATGDPSLAEREGRIVAREAQLLGINHILAPVADVNVDPDNPVINTRSFGEDPQDVARFVTAFVRGVQAAGSLATVKHFPGHGDTHVDSHRALPSIDVPRSRLDAVELVPFRAAIDAGVASVMTAHLAIPAVDSDPAPLRPLAGAERQTPYGATEEEHGAASTVPASLSPRLVGGVLRSELGFDGLVVTDAFDMGALVARFDAGEAAVRAIEAGNDQILKSADTSAAIEAVKAAIRSGRIPLARIDASVRRVLAAKARVSPHVAPRETIFARLDAPEHRAVAREIAERSITLVREKAGGLPLSPASRIAVLQISDFAEVSSPVAAFVSAIAARTESRPVPVVLDARSTEEDAARAADAAGGADLVILALAIRTRSGAGHIAIPPAALRAIAMLPAGVETVAVSFGSPYVLREFPSVPTYLCAWGPQPVLQQAAARALFGETAIGGTLPVTIPGLHPRGNGIRKAAATH